MTLFRSIPRRNVISFALAAIVTALLPLILPPYLAFELGYAGAYAIGILGLIILTGMNGQISLGHGAFMAVGGYTIAIAAARAGWPPEAAMILAALLCAAFGALVGMVALRLTDAYLALATFALAVSITPLLKRFRDLTGGSQGIAFPAAHAPAPLAAFINPSQWLYYEAWAIAAALFIFTYFMLRGRVGRALRAIRDSETAAVSFGINPFIFKTLAFAWSAAYAGIAGAIIASATAFVSPDTYSLQLSMTLLIGAVLGGLGSLWGAVIGGLVVEFLPLWAQSINTAASSLVYGISLIIVMIAMPGGLAAGIRRTVASALGLRPKTQPERN